MTPQAATNEIGRLNRIIDDLRKDKAALHQDVIGQREAMTEARDAIAQGRMIKAHAVLQDQLDHRQRQREPRKTRAAQ